MERLKASGIEEESFQSLENYSLPSFPGENGGHLAQLPIPSVTAETVPLAAVDYSQDSTMADGSSSKVFGSCVPEDPVRSNSRRYPPSSDSSGEIDTSQTVIDTDFLLDRLPVTASSWGPYGIDDQSYGLLSPRLQTLQLPTSGANALRQNVIGEGPLLTEGMPTFDELNFASAWWETQWTNAISTAQNDSIKASARPGNGDSTTVSFV